MTSKGIIRILFTSLAVFLASSAHAGETRLEKNSALDLAALAASGKTHLVTSKKKKIYRVDASAVLNVDFDRLKEVSSQFDRYVEYEMPHLKASRVLDRTGNILHTWNWLELMGQTSKHCYEVRLHPVVKAAASGQSWELYPCPAQAQLPDQLQEEYEDKPAFKMMDGSWYMERLENGKVYVRYYVAARFNTWVPDFIIDWVARQKLSEGVRDLIGRFKVIAAR